MILNAVSCCNHCAKVSKNGLKQYDKLTPPSGIESIQGGKDSNGLSAN